MSVHAERGKYSGAFLLYAYLCKQTVKSLQVIEYCMNMYVYIKFEKKNCEKNYVYTVYWDMKYIYYILIINLKRKKMSIHSS